MLAEPARSLGRGAVAKLLHELIRREAGESLKALEALPLQEALLALELGQELLDEAFAHGVALESQDLAHELRERRCGDSTTTGFMAESALQRGVEVHRVEDAEALLANPSHEPRRPPEHLLVEDAAADPAQEDHVADRRDVDPGGQQVHGDGDVGQPLVLESGG